MPSLILISSPRQRPYSFHPSTFFSSVYKCSVNTCWMKMCPADLPVITTAHFYTVCSVLWLPGSHISSLRLWSCKTWNIFFFPLAFPIWPTVDFPECHLPKMNIFYSIHSRSRGLTAETWGKCVSKGLQGLKDTEWLGQVMLLECDNGLRVRPHKEGGGRWAGTSINAVRYLECRGDLMA